MFLVLNRHYLESNELREEFGLYVNRYLRLAVSDINLDKAITIYIISCGINSIIETYFYDVFCLYTVARRNLRT